jgi:hypothetical protein
MSAWFNCKISYGLNQDIQTGTVGTFAVVDNYSNYNVLLYVEYLKKDVVLKA